MKNIFVLSGLLLVGAALAHGQELRLAPAITTTETLATEAAPTTAFATDTAAWDGMRHLAVGKTKPFRQALEEATTWLPWDPVMFDSQTIVWIDFQQLPEELCELPGGNGWDLYGVRLRPLQVVQPLEPVEEGDWPFYYGRRWKWAADKAGEQRYADLVCAQFGLKELTAAAYKRLLLEPRNWWLKPQLLTLSVWVADLADREMYEKNIAAEIAAWV